MTCTPVRTQLASAPGIEIAMCACGSIHLTLGALTVRLDPTAFERLAETLGEAWVQRRALAHREAPDQAALPS